MTKRIGVYLTLALPFLLLSCGTTGPKVSKNIQERTVNRDKAYQYYSDGYIYELQGKQEKALKKYVLAHYYDPRELDIKRRLQKLHLELNEYKKSVEVGKKILRTKPGDKKALKLIIDAFSTAEKSKKALKYANRFLKKGYSDVSVLKKMMNIYKKLGNVEKTWEIFQLVRKNDESRFKVGYFLNIAEFLFNSEAYKKAKDIYKAALDYSFSPPEVRYKLAMCYKHLGEDEKYVNSFVKYFETARGDYDRLADFKRYLSKQGKYHQYKKKYLHLISSFLLEKQEQEGKISSQVIESIQRDLEQFRDSEKMSYKVALSLGLLSRSKENYEQATGYLERAIELDGELTPHLWLAEIYYSKLEKEVTADSILSNALDESDTPARVYFFWGELLNQNEQYDEAKAKFRQGLSYKNKSFEGLFGFGHALEMTGNRQKSINIFKKLVRLSPRNPTVLNYLGYLLAKSDTQLTFAKKLLRKALKYQPDNGAFLDSYGWVLYKLGNIEKAKKFLKRAKLEREEDPVVWEHLGDVYAESNHIEKAIKNWRKAIELDSKNKTRLKEKIEEVKK